MANNKLSSAIRCDDETIRLSKVLKRKFGLSTQGEVVKKCLIYFNTHNISPEDASTPLPFLIKKQDEMLKEHITSFFRHQELKILNPFFNMVRDNFEILKSGNETKNFSNSDEKNVSETNHKLEEMRKLISELDSKKKLRNISGDNMFVFEMREYNLIFDSLKNLI